MRTKLFLTSAVAFGFIAPAIAEPSHTGSFPSTGLMLEDYTYTNAATSTNMDGVYEGTVNAVAEYENVLYQIGTGQYLPANSETVINCNQPGYFCPGVSGGVNYSENNNQGLTACSTVGDGSYTLSDGTGSSNASCYKTCSASCTNPTAPAHSTNVTYGHETTSGTQYYGSQCDAVTPTCSISFDCVNGYHKRPDITRNQAELVFDMALSMMGQDPAEASESYKNSFVNAVLEWDSLSNSDKNQLQTVISMLGTINKAEGLFNADNLQVQNFRAYMYTKDLTGVESCKSLNDDLWAGETINCNDIQNSDLSSFRQTAQNGDWFIVIPNRNLTFAGHSRCLSEWNWTPCELQYSSLDGQIATSDWYREFSIDGWNFDVEQGRHSASCVEACPSLAASSGVAYLLISTAVATSSSSSLHISSSDMGFLNSITIANPTNIQYMCSANTITINWGDTDSEDVETNNAGTARYGEDIRTPFKAQHKPGKTFTGWRFVDPTKVQAGN